MARDPGIASLDALMNNLGRAATPSVPSAPYGLSLGRLTSRHQTFKRSDIDAVGFFSDEAKHILESDGYVVVPFAPGDLPEDMPNDAVYVCVVDRRAFVEGPWAGGLESNGIFLREQAYALQVFCRKNGIPVWFLDDPGDESFSVIRLKSVSDLVMPYSNDEDFEEGALLPDLFLELEDIARGRFRSEDV